MADCELTNMVMVHDKITNRVLVQERVRSWRGISFPGGHVEPFESFVDSAVREIYEETGLRVENLRLCGQVHWCHAESGRRYVVFLYKTSDFSGRLLEKTEEGRVFWANLSDLLASPPALPLARNFQKYIPLFLSDKYSEAFGLWTEADDSSLIYK
ncbi:MAG: 8-oxo-dGTP diphosphatase [Oscillospiraceae bacterium]|jgi:8-oxo-dGTP diphosphatase|nr:8-oxo-dGTP diphosphatase [Oscillospiraceae bacterium]